VYRRHTILLCAIACLAFTVGAQQQPSTYTVTIVNSMAGTPMEETVYRDGARAVIDITTSASASAKATHVRSVYDLTAHTNVSFDKMDSSGGCGKGTFSGDWGDPFTPLTDLSKAKVIGTEMMNGFTTKVYIVEEDGVTAKLWVDTKSGLPIKITVTQGGKTSTLTEVKSFAASVPAAVFGLPAICTAPAGPPPISDREKEIAADTSSQVGDFIDAVMTQDTGTASACAVTIRVMKAGTMTPITSGYKLSANVIDDQRLAQGDSTPGAGIPLVAGANGVVHMLNAPAHFNLSEDFGNAGGGGGMIRRWCSSPVSTLLLVVRDPANVGKGIDLLWDKNGKFTAK
jgi:hypothetical protein